MEKTSKHAYLIIAHGQFEILRSLISSIDDERNDIFVHIDKKVIDVPELKAEKSTLYLLTERIDVRWGDYSQIQAELELFSFSRQCKGGDGYQYYHLISGQDMPIKDQTYIHDFFDCNAGKEFLGFFQGDAYHELTRKVRCYHLFPSLFSKDRKINARSLLRALFIRIQLLFGGVRNKDIEIVRGTNWVSITNDFVAQCQTSVDKYL